MKKTVLRAAALLFSLFMVQLFAQGRAPGQGQTQDALSRMGQAAAETEAIDSAEYTPRDEYFIGRAVGAVILGRWPAARGRERETAYLNRICQAVVENSPRTALYNGIHVLMLESDQVNAFATPGGHIFITTGLFAIAPSEDALAAVLAHEIAHIQLGHGIDAVRTARSVQQLQDLATQSARRAGGSDSAERSRLFTESVRVLANTILDAGMSQMQEFAADERALELLAGAGYQASGMSDMLRALQANQRSGGLYDTHPSPGQRISNLSARIGRFPAAPPDETRRARFRAVSGR